MLPYENNRLYVGADSISARFFGGTGDYDAFAIGIFAAFSIFSMKIPYPVVGSLIKTWVIAPTSLPFWMIGLPLSSVVK